MSGPEEASTLPLRERRRAAPQREAELWRHAVNAHQRLLFLSEAGRVLSETLEPAQVLERLARLAVPRVAEWCVVDLLDERGRLRLAGVADVDPAKAALVRELRRRFPPRPEAHFLYRVIRRGAPILLGRGADDRLLRGIARSREQALLQRRFSPGSFVCVPILSRAGALGALSFGRRVGPPISAADAELGRDLASRAGAAIENARLYEKARHTDALLSRALSANRMAAWSRDLETGRVERSDNAADIYGAACLSEIGTGLQLIHPADRARYEAVVARAAAEGASYVERFRMVRADGSVSWMEEHGSLTAPGRLSGVVVDITARKLAEDQLSLQQEAARAVSESACLEDAFPRLLAAVGEAMGWSAGRGWLVTGERALKPVGEWARAGSRPRPAKGAAPGLLAREVLARAKSCWTRAPKASSASWAGRCRAFAFPLLGERGVLGVLEFRGETAALAEDSRAELFDRLGRQIGAFLERKAAEAALERQRREQQLILDSVPAMIWYKDGRNRVLRCNRAAAQWCGKPVSEIEGKSAYELFPERGAEYHQDDLNVLGTGKPKLGLIEECVSPAGDKCWVRRDLIPMTDERGWAVGVIVFAVDITKIKQAEEALRESERRQRDFVANVSHEFRTPVAAIKGFAETLRRGGIEDRKNRLTFLRTIESHADRLDWLVQDLLNLSRLGSGMVQLKRQPLALAPFLEEYLRSVSSVVERAGARVELEAEPGLSALADKPHLIQALDNLLSNALKYGRPGGRVRFFARADGRRALIGVSDDGEGIAAEHLPRLFDRFYRVSKGDGGGSSGLGLHIVKTIMEGMGGTVSVESEPGRGASFLLRLARGGGSKPLRGSR